MEHAISLGLAPRRRTTIGDLISWAFGVATVVTNKGKAMFAERINDKSEGERTYKTAPKFIAIGVGAHTAAREAKATDTTLSDEKESRTTGTQSVVTVNQTGDTYQVTGAVTATGSRAVDEVGAFDASSGGNMAFSATIETDNLVTSDSITITWKITQA